MIAESSYKYFKLTSELSGLLRARKCRRNLSVAPYAYLRVEISFQIFSRAIESPFCPTYLSILRIIRIPCKRGASYVRRVETSSRTSAAEIPRKRERKREREREREGGGAGREGAAVTIIAAVKYSSGVPIPTARQRVLKHLSSAFEIVSFGRVLFLESVAR
jgi:hypothetical protein